MKDTLWVGTVADGRRDARCRSRSAKASSEAFATALEAKNVCVCVWVVVNVPDLVDDVSGGKERSYSYVYCMHPVRVCSSREVAERCGKDERRARKEGQARRLSHKRGSSVLMMCD